MKHTAYFFTIITLFIACKQNIKDEKTDQATEVAIQTPNVDSVTTTLQQTSIVEQPKTKDMAYEHVRFLDSGGCIRRDIE